VSKKRLTGFAIAAVIPLLLLAHMRFRGQHPVTSQRLLSPDFILPNIAGGSLQLSTYRGRVVLLDFWATWCEPCREEIPRFVELQDKYRDQGLQIIGVSMDDDSEPVRVFYKQFKMNYPVAMGNAKTGELYGGILGLPIAFLIDPEGRARTRHDGAINIGTVEAEIQKLLAERGAEPSPESKH